MKLNARSNWRTVKLGEVCELNPRRPKLNRASSTPTTFVQMSAVAENGGGIVRPETRPFGQVAKGYTFFAEGDVIFAKITPCMQNGKHAIAGNLLDGIGFGSTEFHVFRPRGEIISEWILNFLLQPKVLTEATRHFTGAVGQQRVPENVLADMEISLPPKDEQRRIAARLREQMAEVERARAAVQAQLDAAQTLPAALLRDIFASAGARRWPIAALGDVSEVVGGMQKTPDRAPREFHKQFLTVRNVQRGYLDLSNVERFEVTPKEFERLRLQRGDLLIVEGNGSVDHIGRNALFNEEGEWIHQNHIIRVRLSKERLMPEFVSEYLNSEAGCAQMLEKAKSTTGLYTLSTKKITSLTVPMPPLAEQQKIAARLDAELTAARALVETLETRLAEIELLPATLLRSAFSQQN
jgi:type I restriction enzyme S subunit